MIKEKLSYPRELEIFKKFLIERKKIIGEDFIILSKKYNIDLKILENIKEEIRRVLGNNIEYLSSTIHLRPRAIDYLKLGLERISQAIQVINSKSNIFHYPVYYQDFEDERPDSIYFGDYHFSLCDVIPDLRGKKFKTSLDFHLSLMEFLSKENWEKEIDDELRKSLDKKFNDFKLRLREEFIQHSINIVKSILKDYQKFFNQEDLRSSLEKETIKIFNINQQLAQIILNNFDDLKPILDKVNIEKGYLEDLASGRIKIVSSEFIFLICILGNLVHIGAEYGKFNNFRSLLGLKILEEPSSPQERFRFFEIKNSSKAENDTLRFLLGIETRPYIYSAKYLGLAGVKFSPIFEISRERIRIIDFYLKSKNFFEKIKNNDYLKEIKLSSKKFINLIEVINYFDFLNDEEKELLKKIFEEIKREKPDKNLEEWIDYYNLIMNQKINQEENINKKRFLIHLNLLIKKLFWWIFRNYLKGNFRELKINLPKEIYSIFLDSFLESRISLQDSMFYGIKLPISLPSFDRADLVFISYLFNLTDKNDFNLLSDYFSSYFKLHHINL